MKIGMLLESAFPPDLRVENEMRTLADAGHEITLFCLNHQKQPARENFAPGITTKRRYMAKSWFNKYRVTVLRWPYYPNWWYRFVRPQADIDVIHVHDLPLARVGAKLADELNIPFVLDLHENWPAAIRIWGHYRSLPGRYFFTDRAWRRYEERMVSRADHVIGVVDEAATRLIDLGLPAEKVSVVSNTLNLAEIKPDTAIGLPCERDVFTLTYFGGLGVHRGLEVVIKAMPIILQDFPNTRLKVLGGGKNLPDLKKLVEELGVSDAVELAGWQACKNVNDVLSLLADADVCLVPHIAVEHTETTIPHKLFQYMYLKKPVLVSSCSPLKRIVEETGGGLVFEDQNPTDFARAVCEMRDLTMRQKLAEKGHQAVAVKYNWRHDAEQLVNIYENLK